MIKNLIIGGNSLIKKAIYFAALRHDGQYRKGTKVPYFAHPVLVAFCVFKYSTDENLLAAAILHDILEDCPTVTKTELQKLFGSKVSKIVVEVSSINKKNKHQNWKEKKRAYLNQIKKISRNGLIVVAADKITNMSGYFEGVQSLSVRETSKLFGGSLAEHFWYYREVLSVLKFGLKNHPIVKEYKKTILHYEMLKKK